MATTKNGLPRRAYAYAPTDDPSTWSLPYLKADGTVDTAALPQSAAAVAEAEIVDDLRANVKSRLRQAYRRWQGDAAEYPDPIRENDDDVPTWDLELDIAEHNTPDSPHKEHMRGGQKGGGTTTAAMQALRRLNGGRPPTDGQIENFQQSVAKLGRFIPGQHTLYEDGSFDGGGGRTAKPMRRGETVDWADLGGRRHSRSYIAGLRRRGVKITGLPAGMRESEEIEESQHIADYRDFHEAEMSFGEIERMLRNALRAEMPAKADGTDTYCYPREVYDDFLIYEVESTDGNDAFKRSYSIVDGEVTLGDPTPVREKRTWVPVAEAGRRNSAKDESILRQIKDLVKELGIDDEETPAPAVTDSGREAMAALVESTGEPEPITFREGADANGEHFVTLREANAKFDRANRTVTITPIKAGWGNARDKFYYTKAALKEATEKGLFNHLKMFKDHPRKSDEKDLPERSVKDWFATTREAYWDEKAEEPRVPIKVHDASDFTRMEDVPEQIAFSVLGGGMARPGKVNGQDGRIVESFRKVNSVDWVTEAGAGGEITFAESAAAEEHDIVMKIEELTDEQIAAEVARRASLKEAASDKDKDKGDAEGGTPEAGNTVGTLSDSGARAAEEAAAEGAPASPTTPADTKESAAAPAAEDFDKKVEDAVAAALLRQEETRKTAEKVKESAKGIVAATLAESTLPKRAKEIVLDSFREAGFGNGFIYADEPAFKSAVDGEIAKAARLLGLQERKAPQKGQGEAEETTPTSVREAVASRMEDKFGASGAPKKGTDTFSEAEGAPAPATAAGASVADRMAERIGR